MSIYTVSDELFDIKKKIASTEVKLANAEMNQKPEEITFLRNLLLEQQRDKVELQKEKNIILARESASSASAGAPSL